MSGLQRALLLIDQLHERALFARIRYTRAVRPVDEEEQLLQLASLHREIARRYRALAPKPRRADDWRDGK